MDPSLSRLVVVTRPESYMHQLGIVTDYTAIIAGNGKSSRGTLQSTIPRSLTVQTVGH